MQHKPIYNAYGRGKLLQNKSRENLIDIIALPKSIVVYIESKKKLRFTNFLATKTKELIIIKFRENYD